MNTAETYDKEYFEDNYKERFEAFKQYYRARTRKALQSRTVDHAPVSNVAEIVYLHDDPNGGVQITTGDFVEYFNRRFGDNDRIGAVRRSLANAARRAEKCPEMDKKRAALVKKNAEKAFAPRSAKPRFAFVNALFALILLLAVGMWGGSTLYLERTESYVMEVEERQAMMAIAQSEENVAAVQENSEMVTTEISAFMSMGAEDHVEVYPVEEYELPPLLSIFAKLGKKD